MSIETELKLHISPEHLQRLKRHPFLHSLTNDRARTLKLYNIYYDTPDLALRHHAMALRLRNDGKQWIQTLKGGGQVSAGLHQRNEWETIVPSEQLDFDVLLSSGGKLPHGVRHHLQPLFDTDFTRNIRLLKFEGAVIEFCMDSGVIRAGRSSCPISELELELISGEPRQLFKLALALLDVVPLQVEHTSKAEYGYLLFSKTKPQATKADFHSQSRSQDVSSTLQNRIGACIAHVQSNVPGALLNLDDEYLHQVRVGMRRLRVILALASQSQEDVELQDLREQVSSLCVELGRARDWDVFEANTLAPSCVRLPDYAGLREVLRACESKRIKQHKVMVCLLGSQNFQRLLLRFGAWLQTMPPDTVNIPIEIFVERTLKKRYKNVVKRGEAWILGDVEQLHNFRIACKKLRYSIELFETSPVSNKALVKLRVLTKLQDVLGRLNDIVVANRLMDDLDNPSRHESLMLVRDWLENDAKKLKFKIRRIWKHFLAQGRFKIKFGENTRKALNK